MTTDNTDLNNPFLKPSFDNDEDPFPEPQVNLTGDKRTEARLCAVQVITQSFIADEDVRTATTDFTRNQLPARKADKKIFAAIMAFAADDFDRLSEMATAQLPAGRTWFAANPVHKAIILAALAEWHSPLSTPPKTVLNEFLNISKGFCTPEETAFINGVLNALMVKLML